MPYRRVFNQVFSVEAGIAAGVAAIVVGLTLFACVRYRARRGSERKPSHRHEWPVVEASYTVAVLLAAVFLVWLSLSNMGSEQAASSQKPALTIRVTGFQWCWRFTYVDRGSTVQGTCNLGKDLPTLVLPAGEPVKFDIVSNDVIHEFWLPHVDMKWEAFPNHVTSYTATFTQEGHWLGHCSEFCGLDHAYMLFWVQVEPRATFEHWLASHQGFHLE